METDTYFKCQDPDCERGEKIPLKLTLSFQNSEGKTVRKCPYCRGKLKEITYCIVCGEEASNTVSLPNGKIHLCSRQSCIDELNLKVNNSFPILWVGSEDWEAPEFTEHLDSLDTQTHIRAARQVEKYLWAGVFLGDLFHEALESGHQVIERERILQAKINGDLPLLTI